MFKEADASLALAPISHIRTQLDRIFGSSEWVDWELETISLDLGLLLDELTRDKIKLLQVMAQKPTLFFEDALFFLYATDVINNKVADFEHAPAPNSLELAYAIFEAHQLGLPRPDMSSIAEVVAYILRQEGYSEPVAPFDFVPASMLSPGQEQVDTEAKKRAIQFYIKHMESL